MRPLFQNVILYLVPVLLACSQGLSAEPVSRNTVTDPGPNAATEPLAKEFSLENATHFLDSASLQWLKKRKCFTCHTNIAYLYARPSISSDAPAHAEVRDSAEALVEKRWREKGPRWDAEVVAIAAALAFNDRAVSGKLHATTRKALDRIWTVQQDNGGFNWLKCDWPPMESDDHYGTVLAAIAVGAAPDDYAQTDAAQKGMAGIRRYLKENPPPTLHHQTMLLWAAAYTPELRAPAARQSTIARLLSLQKDDGGWALATLGDWKRADDSPQDTEHSDGYATGFVVYVLRQAGLSAEHDALRRGVVWLKSNQRASGRWFTRSLHKDSRHFISHAGTAFAVMALAACNELKP